MILTSPPSDSPEMRAQQQLFQAIDAVDANAAEDVLKQNNDVARAKNKDGVPAIVAAVQTGDLMLVRLLLQAAPDSVNDGNANNSSAILFAALGGDTNMLRSLDQGDADLEHCNDNGVNALMSAARKGQREAVKWLSDAGVDLDRKDKSGKGAADHAREGAAADEVLAKAIEKKADERRQARADMFSAIDVGQVSKVAMVLLQHSSAPRWRDANGLTGLMLAAQVGNEMIAKMMIAGAPNKIDAVTRNGSTAFLFAAFNGHLGVLKGLEESGADTRHKNRELKDAMMLAAAGRHFDAIKWLGSELPPEKRLDLTNVDAQGLSALDSTGFEPVSHP